MHLAKIIKVTTLEQYKADCQTLLQAKKNILIYPEMGRNEVLGEFKSWAALVALENNIPVLPMHISGSRNNKKERIKITIGTMINPSQYPEEQALTHLFHNTIKTLEG